METNAVFSGVWEARRRLREMQDARIAEHNLEALDIQQLCDLISDITTVIREKAYEEVRYAPEDSPLWDVYTQIDSLCDSIKADATSENRDSIQSLDVLFDETSWDDPLVEAEAYWEASRGV